MTEVGGALDVSRLTVSFAEGTQPDGPLTPRRYTLTHSDRTGRLFLSIGPDFDRRALCKLQVRLMGDEVLGEWAVDEQGPRLDLHMRAQGGLPLFGTATMRVRIFRGYRPLVVATVCQGDAALLAAHPQLGDAEVVAIFHWRGRRQQREPWGHLREWRPM
jgi:hypothetical protein